MHKQIIVSGEPAVVTSMRDELAAMPAVIGASYHAQASIKPRGDVLILNVLNHGADDVMRRAAAGVKARRINVVLQGVNAFIDSERQGDIARDADEALWEEMESGLRNHGRVSVHFVVLMALGGMLAATGLVLDTVSQAIAFVGASVIAPGFEPIAKVSQALALQKGVMLRRGLLSVAVGYGTLVSASLATFLALRMAGEGSNIVLSQQPAIEALTKFNVSGLLTSAGAALAGTLMIVSLRDTYVVGALMLMVLIPASALAGAAIVMGDSALAIEAGLRVVLDIVLLIVIGAGVFLWKQKRIHRRESLS